MTALANPDARPGAAVGRVILASRLVWPLCAWAVGGAIGVIALDVLDRVRVHSLHDAQPAGIVLPVSFSFLGAMIVSRQPGNRIGWIYLLIGVLMPLQPLGALYYERSVLSGGLPGARWAAWLNTWTVPLVFPAGLSLFAFLLFPSGHLPSERWRPFAWLAVVTSLFGVALVAVDPTPISVLSDLPKAANPSGITALGSHWPQIVGSIWWLATMVLLAFAVGNLALRGRSAGPEERRQVKLLAYAATLTIGFLLVVALTPAVGLFIGNSWWDAAIVLGFGVAVPAACGFAIFKHGLYEIDRLISRTIAYLIVTGLLVGLFFGVVVVTTRVLPFSSPVGVAASTLAAAALFNPLRLRVQRLIDRRFNRARYDAEAVVAAFTLRLRDAVDFDTVREEFQVAVARAVEPAHASLWISPPNQRAPVGS